MKKIVPICVLLFIALSSFAQIDASDNLTIWTGFSIEHKLQKNLKLNFDHQFRFDRYDINSRSSFIEAGLMYKYAKHFDMKAQYRYIAKNEQRNVRRITFDLGTKWKIRPVKHLSFKYRSRFQNSIVTYTGQNITYLRNRVSLDYDITKKWETSIAYENFFRFNRKNEIRSHRYRWTVNYELSKRLEMNVFYQYEQEINKKSPENTNTIGLLLTWQINKRKK